jgi:aspartate/methionine/tyrosine aminotransferase
MQFNVLESQVQKLFIPTPAFPIYESMINYTGSTSVPYDLTEDKDLKFNPEKILSLNY